MTEELRFHIDQYTADLVRTGAAPQKATRRALIEFGNLNDARENCREARGLHPFDELGRQLRHAGRLLRKTPRFTATALVTLAVCLGANLTIFAVVDSILLRPLPFPSPDQLVTVFNTYPKAGVLRDGSSTTNYYERRGQDGGLLGARDLQPVERQPWAKPAQQNASRSCAYLPEFLKTLGRGPRHRTQFHRAGNDFAGRSES